MESFLDETPTHIPGVHAETGDDRIGVVQEQPPHPLIAAIVQAARHPQKTSGLHLVKHTRLNLSLIQDTPEPDFSLSDGTHTIDLGQGDAALCNAVHIMGTAIDETVKACKDRRLVELYKAYARTPEPQQVLDALWGIMTEEEQVEADVTRAFGTPRGFDMSEDFDPDKSMVVEGQPEPS